MFLTFSNCNRDIMKIFMYNSMETTSATRRESVFLIHEDDSEDVAGEVERPEVDLFLKNTAIVCNEYQRLRIF